MHVSWRQRLVNEPVWRDFQQWPLIAADTLPASKRRVYLENLAIVQRVLGGERVGDVARYYGQTPGNITRKLNRCLAGDEDSSPHLTHALIPGVQISAPTRRAPLPSHTHPSGARCAFQQLLRSFPALKKHLDDILRADLKGKANAEKLMPRGLHAAFKQWLTERGHPNNVYPYTTQTLAYESCRLYFHSRRREMELERTQERGRPRSSIAGREDHQQAYRRIEVDEQTLDVKSTIHLEFNSELEPLRVARMALLTAVDVDSSAILGYHIALSGIANQYDLLTLLENCIRPQDLAPLTTPGFEYAQGAAFPAGQSGCDPVVIDTLAMDNALMHSSRSIISAVTGTMKATVQLGLPKSPRSRQLVERIFHYVNQRSSHRFPSTTGSHSRDPKIETALARKSPPRLSFHTLNEAIRVVLTGYNVEPKAYLGGSTPLQTLKHLCSSHYRRFAPEGIMREWRIFLRRQEVTVKWRQGDATHPHVHFLGVKYTGAGLASLTKPKARVIVEYDPRDIRTLRALSKDGEDLGILTAPRSWSKFRHSVHTRRTINRLIKQRRLASHDCLTGYFRALLQDKDQEKGALSLLRVYDEFAESTSAPLQISLSPSQSKPQRRLKWKIPSDMRGENDET